MLPILYRQGLDPWQWSGYKGAALVFQNLFHEGGHSLGQKVWVCSFGGGFKRPLTFCQGKLEWQMFVILFVMETVARDLRLGARPKEKGWENLWFGLVIPGFTQRTKVPTIPSLKPQCSGEHRVNSKCTNSSVIESCLTIVSNSLRSKNSKRK